MARLDDAEIAMLICARARLGEFGRDAYGRVPGVWMLTAGVRIGNQETSEYFGQAKARKIATGELAPTIEGYTKPMAHKPEPWMNRRAEYLRAKA